MSERDLWSSMDSKRDLAVADIREGPRVELRMSKRDLAVADVGERPQVECGLEVRPKTFSLDPQ